MGGELNGFRGRLFGGFDRKDVIAYIEKSSAKRNALIKENEKLAAEAEEMNEIVSRLQIENDELKAKLAEAEEAVKVSEDSVKELKETVIAETITALEDLEKKYENISADFADTSTRINNELDTIRGKMSAFPEIKDSIDDRINNLKKLSTTSGK